MKVWAISSGSYSDYGVDHLFATRELAEAFMARESAVNPHNDYNDIGEWPVLEELPKKTAEYSAYATLLPDGRLQHPSVHGHTYYGDPKGEPSDTAYPLDRPIRYFPRPDDPDPLEGLAAIPREGIRLEVRWRRTREGAEKALQDLAAEVKARIAGVV